MLRQMHDIWGTGNAQGNVDFAPSTAADDSSVKPLINNPVHIRQVNDLY